MMPGSSILGVAGHFEDLRERPEGDEQAVGRILNFLAV